jgi:hypothetical protein
MPKQKKSREPAQPTAPELSQSDLLAKLNATITTTRSADYKETYSNAFRTRIGNGDIAIIFSRLTHSPSIEAAANILEEQVEIIMTWSQLKMFEKTLRILVDALDQEVGEIPIPTGFKPNPEGQRSVIRTLGYSPPATKTGS